MAPALRSGRLRRRLSIVAAASAIPSGRRRTIAWFLVLTVTGYSDIPGRMVMTDFERSADGVRMVYEDTVLGLLVAVK